MENRYSLHGAFVSALLASGVWSPAVAQSTVSDRDASPTVGEQEESKSLFFDTIRVTAQKREEQLVDVPISVVVVRADTLSAFGANEAVDIAYRVPNLGVSNTAGPRSFGFFIRGIGTTSFASESIEGSSAYVVDGVVLGQAGAALSDLPDLERIEVLRGPQGTLFGKNASAGVVNVITKKASDTFEAGGRVSWADPLSERKFQTYVTGPITEGAAYRLSVRGAQRDGTVDNIFDGRKLNDRKEIGVRGRLDLDPASNLSISMIGDYWARDANCCIWAPESAATPPTAFEQAFLDTGIVFSPESQVQNIDGDVFTIVNTWGLSTQADYSFGNGYALTTISAYRDWKTKDGLDSDSRPTNFLNVNLSDFKQRQFTQEIRLASPEDQFIDYVAGLFYFNSDVHSESQQFFTSLTSIPLFNRIVDNYARTENVALFGQGNINLTDGFRVIVGARLIHELAEAEKIRFDPINNVRQSSQASKTDDAIVWRLGAQYDLSEDSNVFATVTRGYKGGGFDTGIGVTALASVDPEVPTNYEIGLRSQFPDLGLMFNITAFRLEVEDLQVSARDEDTTFKILNAASALSQGVESEIYWTPFSDIDLILSGAAAYTDATHDKFVNAPCYPGQTAALGCVAGIQDMTGTPLPFASKWSVNFDMNYKTNLSNGLKLYLDGNLNYRSEMQVSSPENPNTYQDGFALLNGAVGLGSSNDRWKLSLFARNLTDEFYVARRFPTPLGAVGSLSNVSPYEARRIVGVSLDVKY